ncbi:inactive phospholipase C-like protein 2 [Tachysurus ichikawai]
MAEPEAADTARPARDFPSAAPGDSDDAPAAAGARAFLNTATAAVLTGGPGAHGAEVVHSNGGHRSRDSSAERSHGAGNAPCGIMKVSDSLSVYHCCGNGLCHARDSCLDI